MRGEVSPTILLFLADRLTELQEVSSARKNRSRRKRRRRRRELWGLVLRVGVEAGEQKQPLRPAAQGYSNIQALK